MVGLILAFLLSVSVFPTETPQEEAPARHVARVAALLEDPRPEDLYWLKTLFQSLTRIEHGPLNLGYEGWSWMAREGTDAAQANFILYCRRQGLPLPEVSLTEEAGSGLERALALWGLGRLEACREALSAGLEAYPADDRYRGNLDWLAMEVPQDVAAAGTSRQLAQAVLATRNSRP